MKFRTNISGNSTPSISFSDKVILAIIKVFISYSLIVFCMAVSPGGLGSSPGDPLELVLLGSDNRRAIELFDWFRGPAQLLTGVSALGVVS